MHEWWVTPSAPSILAGRGLRQAAAGQLVRGRREEAAGAAGEHGRLWLWKRAEGPVRHVHRRRAADRRADVGDGAAAAGHVLRDAAAAPASVRFCRVSVQLQPLRRCLLCFRVGVVPGRPFTWKWQLDLNE